MDFKKLIQPAIAIAIFLAITFVYFKPQLIDGKVISQSDIRQFKGASKEISDFRLKHPGEEPLWTNAMFSGMPSYQISTLYPNNYTKYLDKVLSLGLTYPAGAMFQYFLGFFILCLCLKLDFRTSIVAALAYGLSSYFLIILEVGHNSKAHALAYVPALLGAVIYAYRSNALIGACLTAIFGALNLYCNHVQISYYFIIVIGIFIAFEFVNAIKNKLLPSFIKTSMFLAVAAVIGVLPNITSLLLTAEYGKLSQRGPTELTIDASGTSNKSIVTNGLDKDYATGWSYGVSETFTLLIPNFKGGASEPIGDNKTALKGIDDAQMQQAVGSMFSYFGNQPGTSGPVYVGAIIVFLFILGLFIIQDRLKWVILIATILSIMLSWGRNFMGFSSFMFDYFPGYNKFRAVSMTLVIAELVMPLLAVLVIDKILKSDVKKISWKFPFTSKVQNFNKALLFSLILTGGFCLVSYVMPTAVNTFAPDNEFESIKGQYMQQGQTDEAQVTQYLNNVLPLVEEARINIFQSDALRSLLFILLGAGALFLFARKTINANVMIVALGLFVLVDLWGVDNRYLNSKRFTAKAQSNLLPTPKPADDFILNDNKDNARVINMAIDPFNNSEPSYFHQNIGGYHAAKLKRYQELIEFHISKNMNIIRSAFGPGANDSVFRAAFEKCGVLNMLNVKYFIYSNDAQPLVNRYAAGPAWFVSNVKTVQTANDEILELGKVNPTQTAIINTSKFASAPKDNSLSKGSIKRTSYEPNHQQYESENAGAGLAIFSEIYYPKGWNAYIDGQKTDYICANYALRGLSIPAGKHKIDFKFEPETYRMGEKVALAGSIILFGALLFLLWSLFLKKEVVN
jgi:Bacterial membrane protein YfhO